MFFQNIVATDSISAWVAKQIDATRGAVKYGWDVDVRPHKKPRTVPQNRYMMAVLTHIVSTTEQIHDGGIDAHCSILQRHGIYAGRMQRMGDADRRVERVLEIAFWRYEHRQIIHGPIW